MFTKNRILFLLGTWVILVPFLGFPSSFKSFFIIVSGLLIIVVAFLFSREKRMGQNSRPKNKAIKAEVATEVYAENMPVIPETELLSEDLGSFKKLEDEKYTDLEAIKEHSRSLRS